MNEERCARAAPPREERGPGAPPPRLRVMATRVHGMDSRTETTSAAVDTVLPRVAYRRQKPEFPADDFLGQSRVLSHRNAACAGARLSFLLAGVEAASPRGIYN